MLRNFLREFSRRALCSLGVLFLAACQPAAPVEPTTTAVVIVKLLATAYISPTPNAEQAAATRAAITPSPVPVTPTAFPTITPYVGIFIGEAPQEIGFAPITEPLLGLPQDVTPTADAARCRVPLALTFLTLWQTDITLHDRIGCPIQESFGFFAETQIFDNGTMYWRRDTGEVWAMLPGDPAGRFWYVAEPAFVSTEEISAPPGRRVPDGDIGSVWAGIDDLREAMGFAQTGLQRVALNLQRYDSGTFLLDATVGQIFALIVDGTAYGPFPAPELSAESLLTPDATATPEGQ